MAASKSSPASRRGHELANRDPVGAENVDIGRHGRQCLADHAAPVRIRIVRSADAHVLPFAIEQKEHGGVAQEARDQLDHTINDDIGVGDHLGEGSRQFGKSERATLVAAGRRLPWLGEREDPPSLVASSGHGAITGSSTA